jgi:hypothetical protein
MEEQTSHRIDQTKFEYLEHLRKQYKIRSEYADFRKSRCELLMNRKSARKWSEKKAARVARQLQAALRDKEVHESTLLRIDNEIKKLKEQHKD